MKLLIEGFANQLKEAIEIGEKIKLNKVTKPFGNVVVTGMGGSGIGGTLLSELVAKESKVPILVNKNYFLPSYVDENSLVIVSSYSGNTEETIQSLESALERGAKIVSISSGGKLKEIAEAQNIDHITIPSGMPPRAALGYSLVQMLFTLYNFDIIGTGFKEDLYASISLLEKEKDGIQSQAENIAKTLLGKTVVIYSPFGEEGVALRLRQELNENSKVLAWHNTIPEMNHNELVGWIEKRDDLAVVFFRNNTDYARVSKRIDLTKEIVLKYASKVVEIYSKGNSPIERAMYHVNVGDFISSYLAEMRNIDPNEIQVIEYLKSSLGGK